MARYALAIWKVKPEAVHEYEKFMNENRERRRLNEAKLLLVGQGGVGKTSLVRYLVHKKKAKPGEQKTEGIDITTWQAPSKIENEASGPQNSSNSEEGALYRKPAPIKIVRWRPPRAPFWEIFP